MLEPRARGAARAAGGRAPSASSASWASPRTTARLLAFRAELGDFFEAALSADGVGPAQPLANWVINELTARIDSDADLAEAKVQPAALAQLVGMVDRQAGDDRRRPSRCSTGSSADGGDPAAIVEAEGLGGDRRRRRARRRSSTPRSPRTPTSRRSIRGGNMKAIGAIIGHVMRETKGRADGGEVTRLVREKLAL